MKLQNLIIIFLAIALPVVIILSFYVGMQVDTASLKITYDNYLINAAHETVLAFELNTTNDAYATLTDTKIRDIEAAINVFSSSLATSMGATGANTSRMMSYVPALVFTLYDGYYIYSPTEKAWNTETLAWNLVPLTHELKSYVYYSKEYRNSDKILTINYSLDNYVVVYYYNGRDYISRAGYLESERQNVNNNEAVKYYDDAIEFTSWFNSIIQDFGDQSLKNKLIIHPNNKALPREVSTFNDEKHEVIKNSIITNLLPAMQIYGYEMPKLTDEDWVAVLNNVCFIAFMQDLPVRN